MGKTKWYMILDKRSGDVLYSDNFEDVFVFVNDKARRFENFVVEKVPNKMLTPMLVDNMMSRSLCWSLDGERVLSPDEMTDYDNLYEQMDFLVKKLRIAIKDVSNVRLEKDTDTFVRETLHELYKLLNTISNYDFYCELCNNDENGYIWYENFNSGYLLDTIIKYYTGDTEGK
jgi:hypothetical protein